MAAFRLFDLNPQQEEAVRRTEGPVLVLAGAGTGKTRVITARIAYLIHHGTNPSGILAVTFTNKAANEMRERIAGIVEREKAKQVTVSTFHSLCVRILRQSIEKLGYKRNFTIYTESEQAGLLKRIIARTLAKEESLDHGLASFLIGKAKNEGLFGPPENDQSALAEVFRRYNQELRKLNAVDFDDLLLLAVKVLREHPDERAQWQGRFSHIMVDEFQDTNSLQLQIVKLLAGDPPNVCVVGDDDQSIYSWRGAEVSNILEFERHFPNPAIIKLEQNYRSTNAILHTANSLIKANARRREKNLWSKNGDGERVRLVALPDEREEADFVVAEIQRMQFQSRLPYEAFAVLYRMNAQSRLIEEALRRLRIPYRLIGGKSFFDRREIKDLVAYASVLLNPDDDISLLRVINNPARGISDNTVERAMAESVAQQCPLHTILKDTSFQTTLSSRAASALKRFLAQMDHFESRLLAPLANHSEVISAWLQESGYMDALPRSCKTPEEAESRLSNIRSVLEDLRNHQMRSSSGLAGFLDDLALDDDKNDEDKKDKAHGVTLITLHAAKGLEFPHVFLIGLEEGILPHERSKLEGSLDEERRLFYVGITRAMQSLTLTRAQWRTRYGDRIHRPPSSFIAQLDDKFLDHVDPDTIRNAETTEEEATAHFERIRALIRAASKQNEEVSSHPVD